MVLEGEAIKGNFIVRLKRNGKMLTSKVVEFIENKRVAG
jgi:hypothetical protein